MTAERDLSPKWTLFYLPEMNIGLAVSPSEGFSTGIEQQYIF